MITQPMELKQEIQLAENLKRIMDSKRLSVTMTAKKVGMHKSTLHGYCNGVLPRNLRKLQDLSEFLDVSLTTLIFGGATEEIRMGFDGKIEGRYEVIIRRVNESGKKR